MADNNFIFRLYEGGNTGTDWHENTSENPYTINDIGKIPDPQGAASNRQITSIPSPFARLHLMESAFRIVNNTSRSTTRGVDLKKLGDKTIYHKLVSDCLDIAEIFFKIDLFKLHENRDLKIVTWNKKDELKHLLENGNSQHKLFGETLQLFLGQDGSASNFDKIDNIHLLVVDYKIVGATSPSTLFFSSGNDLSFAGFKQGNDTFFDNDYCPLYKRSDILFLKYLYGLFKINPKLTSEMDLFWDYLQLNKEALAAHNPNLHRDLVQYINELTPEQFKSDYTSWSNQQPVFVLNEIEHLKKNTEIVQSENDNDFLIKSTKYEGNKPPVVLQNGFARPLRFFGGTFNPATVIPYKDDKPLHQRLVPGQDAPYPYLTVSDFLEPYLVRVPFPVDSERFFTGNPDGFYAGDIHTQDPPDDMFLLPIKDFYFAFFDVKDLMDETVDGSKIFKLVKISDTAVKVELLIPISKTGEYIKFERMYTDLNSTPDEYANEGALIESNLNLGFLPYNLDNKVSNQIIGLISKSDRVELDFLKDLTDTCSPVEDKYVRSTTKTTMASGLDLCSTYYILEDNYDLIRVKDNKTGAFGMVIPKPNKSVMGSTKKFVFAVDFGTTNSHVEYTVDGLNPQPFNISKDKKQVITLVDGQWGATDPLLLDLLERELIPFSLGNFDDDNKFPTRTAVSEIDSFDHMTGMNAIADINIPFEYEKKATFPSQIVTTNLKWNPLSGNSESQANVNRVKAFVETLMIMMKNKVLLNAGALEKTEIIWFYPSSMSTNQINQYRKIWNELYKKHFNLNGKAKDYSESEVPFYTHDNKVNAYEYPVINIDIGGGTTDIVVFKDEQPQFMTSVRFAGNAVFGDAYSVTKKMDNGFVTIFKPYVENFLSANHGTLSNLYEVFNQMNVAGQSTSSDMMAFFFSIENNSKVKNSRELDFSVSKAIANHGEFNIVFLIFYSAIVYHIARLMNTLGLKMPRNICFSGNGSKIINLLDTNDELESLEEFSMLIFEKVYEQEYHKDGMQLIQGPAPKEATCKGGIIKHQMKVEKNKFDKIVLLGDKEGKYINPRKHNFEANNLKYGDVKDNDQIFADTIAEIERFIDIVFDINEEFSLEEYFGIDTGNLSRYRDVVKGDLSANLRKGFQARLKLGAEDRNIEESLFFYPLVSSIYRLTQEIARRKS